MPTRNEDLHEPSGCNRARSSLFAKALAAFSLISSLGLTQNAEARQVLTLDYGDAEINGAVTLYIKRDLQRAYPNLPIEGMIPISIEVETKLRDYSGDVTAQVGSYMSERQAVYGDPRRYYDPSPSSFNRLFFRLSGYDNQGVWQLHFNGGLFKVRRVTIELEDRYRPEPPRPGPGYPDGPRGPGRGGWDPRPGRPDRDGWDPQPGRPDRDGRDPGRGQRGAYTEIDCMSWDRRPTFCPAGFWVESVRVIQQFSNSPCVSGQTFFIERDGIRVAEGCRARFAVSGR